MNKTLMRLLRDELTLDPDGFQIVGQRLLNHPSNNGLYHWLRMQPTQAPSSQLLPPIADSLLSPIINQPEFRQ